ncbi:MAG: glycolate oxidase subunit GlcF [Pseudomonadales bacterium]|nr:glycolate oxidase subunit GlcF [Pseudomonadales bacterium]
MRTELPEALLATEAGREADAILRSCVHCGFCTATCPTYQVLGDERDGPRGRISLIKEMLERGEAGADTQTHLDRCLTCRACETTCPSGVRYGRLLEIGRERVEATVPRSRRERLLRALLLTFVPHPLRLAVPLRLGQWLRPLLPEALAAKVPPRPATRWRRTAMPGAERPRRVLLFRGCVQSLTTPETNAAASHVLARLGIRAREAAGAGCCGALPRHLSRTESARAMAQRNVDALIPELEAGAEAILSTASGCGVELKDYAELLKDDEAYAARAARVAAATRDLSEFLLEEDLAAHVPEQASRRRIAWHSPCTLQHGQRVVGAVERILDALGFQRVPVAEAHLCCGSAGTYSILQAELATELRDRKVAALTAKGPERIVTANVGCQLHIGGGTEVPVTHWIELVAERLAEADG